MTARAALNAVYRTALQWSGSGPDDFDEVLTADPVDVEQREAADMLDRIRAAGGAVA